MHGQKSLQMEDDGKKLCFVIYVHVHYTGLGSWLLWVYFPWGQGTDCERGSSSTPAEYMLRQQGGGCQHLLALVLWKRLGAAIVRHTKDLSQS